MSLHRGSKDKKVAVMFLVVYQSKGGSKSSNRSFSGNKALQQAVQSSCNTHRMLHIAVSLVAIVLPQQPQVHLSPSVLFGAALK